MVYGHVMVGLWMENRQEVDVMLKAIEGALRQASANSSDRAVLERWRGQAQNFCAKAKQEDWAGWQ